MSEGIIRVEQRVAIATCILDCMELIDPVLEPPNSRFGFGSRAELLVVILALAELAMDDEQRSILMIAKRLGMSRMTVKRRLDDLVRLGLVHYVDGKPRLYPEAVNTPRAVAITRAVEDVLNATCVKLQSLNRN